MGKTKKQDKRTRLYRIWSGMRGRCKKDGSEYHKNWGGRGVSVCDEWNDFNTFREWAIKNGYDETLTIDRINNDGDYEPSNCRWITYKEQSRNMRSNRYIEINGEQHIIPDWCEILGTVTPSTVYARMRKYGWTAEKALLTPGQKHVSFEPKKTDEKFKKCRIPLIARNETETLHFDSGKDVERHGFNRKFAMKAAKGMAKCKTNRHYYKGYKWEINEELLSKWRNASV